jgi:Tfp pilus assembly protein PilO
MSGRTRFIGAIALVLLVLLVIFFFFIRPRRAELAEVRQQIEAEEMRTQSLQAELNRLWALQADEPQLRAELAELQQFVPRNHQIPNFIFQVQDAANRSGVSFLQINPELPKSPPEGAALAEVRIQLGAQGGYFAIQDFLRRLYALDRALRIDLLQMTGAEDDVQGVNISLTTTSRIFFDLPTAAIPGATEAPVDEPVDTEGETNETEVEG